MFERRRTTNTDVPLCSHHSRFTDDTVLTVATPCAILDGHRIPIEVALPADCPVQGVAFADQVEMPELARPARPARGGAAVDRRRAGRRTDACAARMTTRLAPQRSARSESGAGGA